MSNSQFFSRYLSDARQASAATRVLPSVILAQWADETAYGQSLSSAQVLWNFAGITYANLAAFPNETAGLDAYIQTLNLSYYNGVRQASGAIAQAGALGKSPWAASHYDARGYDAGLSYNQLDWGVDLVSIIQANNLTSIDPSGSNNVNSNRGLPPGVDGPASPYAPNNSVSPVSNLGATIVLPPPGMASSIALDSFTINGLQADVNVSAALVDIGIDLEITQSSIVTMTLHDPSRTLVNNPTFGQLSVLTVDGASYQLAALDKQGNVLTVTFEPVVVAALRNANGPLVIQPGQMSRTDFAALLVSQIQGATFSSPPKSWLLRQNQGYGQPSGLQEQLSRGTAADPSESSWTCLQRIAAEIGFRCFEFNTNVYFGPDSWLIAQPPSFVAQEFVSGVYSIDGTWDTGQPVGQITVTCTAGSWTPGPGQSVAVTNLGPFSGTWMVSAMSRSSLFQPDIIVTLQTPQPSLHEPTTGGAAPATGTQTVGGSAAAGNALAYAQRQIGHPYLYGGENPNTGFDCSGLMQAAYLSAGINIPRTSEEQFAAGPSVPAGAVNLLPGDLVFFGSPVNASHVGMVVSVDVATGIVTMIDAPHTGAFVRTEPFTGVIGAMWGADEYLGATRPAT